MWRPRRALARAEQDHDGDDGAEPVPDKRHHAAPGRRRETFHPEQESTGAWVTSMTSRLPALVS
jgi:hypothetical protein